MESTALGAALRQIDRLFDEGTVAGLPDTQLLDRFLARRDAAAFEVLVARHGPMVLAVCRATLKDRGDLEDTFQATFLVLVKKATSIRGREALGAWLHRVAHRVASQANADAARRREQERIAGALKAEGGIHDEEQAALHEELARLPEKYRAPLLLCYFEGLTHAQAAFQLRCGEATVRRRLTEARDLVRSRLARRGIAPAGGVLGLLTAGRAEAAVPALWAESTIRLALNAVAGRLATGIAASALAERVSTTSLLTKLTLSGVSLVALAAAWLAVGAIADGAGPKENAPRADGAMAGPRRGSEPKAPLGQGEKVELRGRVFGPDRQPRGSAKIYLAAGGVTEDEMFPTAPPVRAASGPDGRFRFQVSRDELVQAGAPRPSIALAALAEGFGPGWVRLDSSDNLGREWDLRLVEDDVPITGRVLDLEGRPVAGASVGVNNIIAIPGGDVPAWLRTLRDNQGRVNPDLWGRMSDRLSFGFTDILPTSRTDAEGRFRLTGVGRDRIAVILAKGPTIVTDFRVTLTTADPNFKKVPLPGDNSADNALLAPHFDILAAPARSVTGSVRDRDTGKPLSGVRVLSFPDSRAVTDDQGHYRLTGLKKSGPVEIVVTAEGQPYPKVIRSVGDAPGLGPATVDFSLKRGVWVEGRVTDRASGRPVPAVVEYYPFRDNPTLAEVPDFSGLNNNVSDDVRYSTDADGRFRAVAFPGAGLLAVQAKHSRYLTAKPLAPEVAGKVLHAGNFQYQMPYYQGLAVIDATKGAKPLSVSIALEPARGQQGLVLGPDERPLAGTRVYGLEGSFATKDVLPTAEFTYNHPGPGQVETLTFLHEAKRLGGFIDVKGDENTPLRVRLQPTGTVIGRLVDEDGQPRPDVELLTLFLRNTRGDTMGGEHLNSRITTDRDGRFRVERLVPGIRYELEVIQKKGTHFSDGYVSFTWWTVRSGEVKDWGDVREKKIGAN